MTPGLAAIADSDSHAPAAELAALTYIALSLYYLPEPRGCETLLGPMSARRVAPSVAPPVRMYHLGQRLARQQSERIHRPADRHHGKCIYVIGQAEQGAHFVLAAQVIGGDRGSEAQPTAREDDVLHCGIDAGATDPRGVGKLVLMVPAHLR